MDYPFMTGFGGMFATEAIKGALPEGQNTPQKAPYGLYAEQVSGTAFTRPRHRNLRSWLYRIQPSVVHNGFKPLSQENFLTAFSQPLVPNPNPMRWSPLELPQKPTDFIQGMLTLLVNGSSKEQTGCAVHLYVANASMDSSFFSTADGECLIVPQAGALEVRTEMGDLSIAPGHIAVVPRGIKFQVLLKSAHAAGYLLENFGEPLQLPDLGPIGANGLANPRDFLTPKAAFEEKKGDFEWFCKYAGALWHSKLDHSPLDVVAWHGNYAPYQYDLARFCTINTVSFDHLDPSIFTVLTSPSDTPGMANLDFVIFPERWMVAENTFRPPYFHRNLMSEYMGLIKGEYDAKAGGFLPGGGSLHNMMCPHGPDAETFKKASEMALEPEKLSDTLAFMFESRYPFMPTKRALAKGFCQMDYLDCWKNLEANFSA